MKKIKLLTPIFALATTASVVVPLTSCTKAHITYNSQRDGIYSEFKPRGEYTNPIQGTYSYEEAWNKYFDNKCVDNMLVNDIARASLHTLATGSGANISMSIKVTYFNKKTHCISFTNHIYGTSESEYDVPFDLDITLDVKKLHYDSYAYRLKEGTVNLFAPTWMKNQGNKLWKDFSWYIKCTGNVKFTVDAINGWYDLPSWPDDDMVIQLVSLEPWYFNKITLEDDE